MVYLLGTMAYKINKQLGAKIQRERKGIGMSQMKLAEITGVQTTTIGNIERGETDTSVYTIFKIAEALKLRIKELFTFR